MGTQNLTHGLYIFYTNELFFLRLNIALINLFKPGIKYDKIFVVYNSGNPDKSVEFITDILPNIEGDTEVVGVDYNTISYREPPTQYVMENLVKEDYAT
ncbi:unnamed protein product, partial [marine sediment metagenome]